MRYTWDLCPWHLMPLMRFWEKGSPEDLQIQVLEKAIARPLQGNECLHFGVDPGRKDEYFVTSRCELIDKNAKEAARKTIALAEAEEIAVRKAAEKHEAEAIAKNTPSICQTDAGH